MAVKLLMRSGFWSVMVMSLRNVIQTFPLSIDAPYLKVPGLGSSALSLGSVTWWYLRSLPMLLLIFPAKPTEHVASCWRFLRQSWFDLQQQSITLMFKPSILVFLERLGFGAKKITGMRATKKWLEMALIHCGAIVRVPSLVKQRTGYTYEKWE